MTHSNSQEVHNGYRGLELNIKYNLENDSRVVFSETYTQGSYEVFVMVNSVIPEVLHPKKRFWDY